MISKATSYAIQSLAFLAVEQEDGEYIPVSELAEQLKIPYHFLKKVIAQLVAGGLLNSYRSAKGGVALARPSADIKIIDIILLVDGPGLFSRCIIGLPGCSDAAPCALHTKWAPERDRLIEIFTTSSLESMAQEIREHGFRISA